MRSFRGIPLTAASSRAHATVVWLPPIPRGCAMTPCIMSAMTAWRPVVSAADVSSVRACARVRDLMHENSRPAPPVWTVAHPIAVFHRCRSAANCAVIGSANDRSGHAGQNGDLDILGAETAICGPNRARLIELGEV